MKGGLSRLDIARTELLGPLGDGPRRFLAFQFLNVIAWQGVLGGMLVLHARALGISAERVGLLNSFMFFTSILGLLTKPLAERIGSKRLLMSGWTLRNVVVAPLVLSPWVFARWGTDGAMILLGTTVLLFCTARSLAGIAWSSWLHEIVPSEHLARFYALDSMLTRILAVLFGVAAFFVLGQHPPLWRFAAIAAVSITIGLCSIRVMARVPGGAPVPRAAGDGSASGGYRAVLRDTEFLRFIGCTGLAGFVFGGQGLLWILLLRDRLGFGPGLILLLSAVGSLSAVVTGFRWRRVADALGGSVTIAATNLLMVLCLAAMIPLAGGGVPLPFVVAICLLLPASEAGNYIAVTRAYMLRMQPDNRHAYNAVWSACAAVGGGISSVLLGQILRVDGPLPFILAALGYALLMLLASVLVFRLPEKGRRAAHLPCSALFDPRRALLSMAKIWWYVLRPGPAAPLREAAGER